MNHDRIVQPVLQCHCLYFIPIHIQKPPKHAVQVQIGVSQYQTLDRFREFASDGVEVGLILAKKG